MCLNKAVEPFLTRRIHAGLRKQSENSIEIPFALIPVSSSCLHILFYIAIYIKTIESSKTDGIWGNLRMILRCDVKTDGYDVPNLSFTGKDCIINKVEDYIFVFSI